MFAYRYTYEISIGRISNQSSSCFKFAPTQLHLNSWAVVQAFQLICKFLHLKVSPQVFLYFYSTRSGKRAGWLSLISQA